MFARYYSAIKEMGTKAHRARLEIRVNSADLVRVAASRLSSIDVLRFYLDLGCITVTRSRDIAAFALAEVLTARAFVASFRSQDLIAHLPLTYATHLMFCIINRPVYFGMESKLAEAVGIRTILLTRGFLALPYFIPSIDKGVKYLGGLNWSDEDRPGCLLTIEAELSLRWRNTFHLHVPKTTSRQQSKRTAETARAENAKGLAARRAHRPGEIFDNDDIASRKHKMLAQHSRPFHSTIKMWVLFQLPRTSADARLACIPKMSTSVATDLSAKHIWDFCSTCLTASRRAWTMKGSPSHLQQPKRFASP